MFRLLVPRLALSAVLLIAAYFVFFESVYLRDQSAQFGEVKIAVWMWVFRIFTTLLVILGISVLIFRK